MNWLILILAGIMEVMWAVGMKYSNGFTRLVPTVFTIITMSASVYLLSIVLRVFPLGLTYAVWTGIGAAGTAIIGMMFLGEPREILRIICILLIITGILGLKLLTKQ